MLRADLAAIQVGNRTNLQDNCVVHNDIDCATLIGNDVSVGHSAVLHGATVEDSCLIGMSSVLMNGATIGAGSLVAAGAVVTEGVHIPPNSLVVGVPAQVKRFLNDDERAYMERNCSIYLELAMEHKAVLSAATTG